MNLPVAILSRDEARQLTDEVKRDGERLWRKLVELHDGGAPEILGYSSWHAYCEAEFGFKQAQAYRLLHAGQAAEIIPRDNRPNERQARELSPLRADPAALRSAWDEATTNGNPTADRVREVVQSRMGVHYSSETPEWSTPQDLYDQLDAEFGFTLDVCATAKNAKCDKFYTEADDGLARPWSGVCWMNPPYGDVIAAWVAKAHNTCLDGRHTVVCLVPARTDTAWWWNHARYGEVRFLRGRLKFGGGENSAPFPSAVVIFGASPRVIWWER